MGLTVTVKNYLESVITGIVEGRIAPLEARIREFVPGWQKTAKEELVSPSLLVALDENARLEEEKKRIEDALSANRNRIAEIAEEDHPSVFAELSSPYGWRNYDIISRAEQLVSRIIRQRVEELSKQTEEGVEIIALRQVQRELGTALMLATTNRKLTFAFLRLKEKFGDKFPSELTEFLSDAFPEIE